jgi:hypothetical protein
VTSSHGDEGVDSGGGGLKPHPPSSLVVPSSLAVRPVRAAGRPSRPAQPPAAGGQGRVPPRQERRLRGLQVPGPHPRVRRAGQRAPAFPPCFFLLRRRFCFRFVLLRRARVTHSCGLLGVSSVRRRAGSGST